MKNKKSLETKRERKKTDRRFVSSAEIFNKQKRHFLFATIAPIAACIVWFVFTPHVYIADLGMLIAMWTLTGGLGISIGYHRYFTHSSFVAHPVLQFAMASAGSMAGQGPIIYWVAVHRCHHQHSDEELDPHTPHSFSEQTTWMGKIKAFFHGHIGWVFRHKVPSPIFFSRDLLKNSIARYFDRSYRLWVAIGIIGPGIIMLAIDNSVHGFLRGCIFGGLLRMVLGNQIIWAINSVCHTSGDHHFDTQDDSTNNWLLSIPAFGEGWHNNHHAFPWSARFGLLWWQLDLGWVALRALAMVGLVSNLKQPAERDFQRIAALGRSNDPISN